MSENTPVKLDCMYKLAKNFEDALEMVDEDWVLTDEALAFISEAKMDITQKTENIFKILRFFEWQVEMMTAEKNYINSKQKFRKNDIERIKKLLKMGLDTVSVEEDKKGKKTQKIKTLKWSAYYTFKESVSYDSEKIDKSYLLKKKKLKFSDTFTLEALQKVAPEMVEEVETEVVDYEKLRFDYDRAIKNNEDPENQSVEVPEGITIWEDKTFCTRK